MVEERLQSKEKSNCYLDDTMIKQSQKCSSKEFKACEPRHTHIIITTTTKTAPSAATTNSKN